MQNKITFITKRKDHKVSLNTINDITPVIEFLKNEKKLNNLVGLDTENSSLNPFYAVPLLLQIGNKEKVFVIDRTSIDCEFLREFTDVQWLGHNLQYDFSIIGWNEGKEPIYLRNLNDTMVAEQIVRRGIISSNSLEALHLRRLGKPFPVVKNTRRDFINATKNFVFEDIHIEYASTDILVLHDIFEAIMEVVNKSNLNKRVEEIGFKYIPILGERLLNGTKIDKDKWKVILNENKIAKIECEKKLDNELIKLGYKTTVRKKQLSTTLSLFDDIEIEVSNNNVKNVNYGSSQQILEIFKFFKVPIPQVRDNKTYEMKDSAGAEALEQYLLKYPDTKLRTLINLLIEYSAISKRISSFGINFLYDRYPDPNTPYNKKSLKKGYFCDLTGKVHTCYKQEFTKNGRNSSGSEKNTDKDKGKRLDLFFNSQNIPKEARYRECFILEPELKEQGWVRMTLDLAGAELKILGALSGDKKLLELQDQDLHSYLATAAFTKMYNYITTTMKPERADKELYDLLRINKIFEIIVVNRKKEDGTEEFVRFYTEEEKHQMTLERIAKVKKEGKIVIDKKSTKDIRDSVKNAVYAACYGATENRISTTLNIGTFYAGLLLEAFREELPVAFGFLKKVADIAVNEGYVIFNERTNSRHIFNTYQEAVARGKRLSESEKSDIMRNAMNYIISGTQADMIKESEVAIDTFLKQNNIKHKHIFQVHDEFVLDIEDIKYGKELEKIIKDTCNLYLKGLVDMTCNVEYLDRWTK